MAIDNSLYDSIENTYIKIQTYLDNNKLGPEHSAMIIKHEELGDLLERLDIEAIEEQSKDINSLHEKLTSIKKVSDTIIEILDNNDDSVSSAAKIVNALDEVFSKINPMIV